jgi:hypothetical protein
VEVYVIFGLNIPDFSLVCIGCVLVEVGTKMEGMIVECEACGEGFDGKYIGLDEVDVVVIGSGKGIDSGMGGIDGVCVDTIGGEEGVGSMTLDEGV